MHPPICLLRPASGPQSSLSCKAPVCEPSEDGAGPGNESHAGDLGKQQTWDQQNLASRRRCHTCIPSRATHPSRLKVTVEQDTWEWIRDSTWALSLWQAVADGHDLHWSATYQHQPTATPQHPPPSCHTHGPHIKQHTQTPQSSNYTIWDKHVILG